MENKNTYVVLQNLSSPSSTSTVVPSSVSTSVPPIAHNNNSNKNESSPIHSTSLSLPPTPTTNQTTSAVQSVPPASRRSESSSYGASAIHLTQPTVNRLLSNVIKQEQVEEGTQKQSSEQQSAATPTSLRVRTDSGQQHSQQQHTTVISPVHLNHREVHSLSVLLPMAAMTVPVHITEAGAGPYYVPVLTTADHSSSSSYKLASSSSNNNNPPSPSSSSTSSNPPSNHRSGHTSHYTPKQGGDPTRKREMRLQKNREAARECRRKKKEYIKCLEERVTGLENQNKALIEELRELKKLYCDEKKTTANRGGSDATPR